MILEETLEIFLITYNRFPYLKRTLEKIISEDSPIKNCSITILDNCSSDGTSDLCHSIAKRHENVTHIRHKKNIGGNANIVCAMEMAAKEYFWILCDDDDYDFSHFDEVIKALEEKADAVMVERNLSKEEQVPEVLFNEMGFAPAGIYRTENITPTVLQNAYMNIYHFFPHLALVSYLINNHKNIVITNHTIVFQGFVLKSNQEYVRDERNEEDIVHFKQTHICLPICYINSARMLNDKKLRYRIAERLWLTEKFYRLCDYIIKNNFCFDNFTDVFSNISNRQRIIFLLVLIKRFFSSFIQRIFSIKNNKKKDRKVIFFLGFKISLKRRKKQ